MKVQSKVQQLVSLQHQYNQLLLQFKALEDEDIFLRADDLRPELSQKLTDLLHKQHNLEETLGKLRQNSVPETFKNVIDKMEGEIHAMFEKVENETA